MKLCMRTIKLCVRSAIVWVVVILSFTINDRVLGQCATCKIPTLRFRGNYCAEQAFTITLPAETTGSLTKEGAGCGVFTPTKQTSAKMKPFKAYTLTSSGIKVSTAHIDFDVPDGYRLYIDNEERSTIDVSGLGCVGWSKSWEVELRGCGPDDKAGASSGPQLGSVIWSVSLGRLNNGTSAGAIHLHEDQISSAIHTPGLLYYSGSSSEVEIIKTGGVLRQIKAPQALADIVILSASEYEVRLYQPSQVGAFSGVYAVAGNPLTAWRIRNPDAPSPNPTRVEFTLINSTGEVTSVIEHSGASWTLNRAGNLYRETHLRTGNIKTVTVLNENGTEALKRDEYFTSYAWGEEKTMEVNDPAGSPQTTVWQYNTDAAEEHAYGKLKSVTRPDGGWERYEYSSAAVNFGRLICIYRPWLNLPATPEEATETNGHCTLINYAHQGGSVFAAMPSLFEERILGVTVRKQTYTDVVTTATGMSLKSMKGKSLRQYLNYAQSMLSSHLVYTSSSGANNTPDWLQERPAQDTNKDGTRTVYSYVQGSFDEVARTFSPGTGLAVRGYAEQWKSGQYSGGVVGKSTRIESVMDGLGRKVFEETQVLWAGPTMQLCHGRTIFMTETVSGYLALKKMGESQAPRHGRAHACFQKRMSKGLSPTIQTLMPWAVRGHPQGLV